MNIRALVKRWWLVGAVALLVPGASAWGQQIPIGEVVESLPSAVDPTATYTLYIPEAAASAPASPVLLIFDPRGRAKYAAELFVPAADRFGWILISSHDSRSDGPWAPNQKAIDALWPELQRFRVDRKRIYATGFSGGAIVSIFLAQATHEIAGVIGVGGRLPPEIPTKQLEFAHFGAAGWWDFNYDEMHEIDELVAKRKRPHRLELFHGPHSWFDVAGASQAVEWMELQAMRLKLRPTDPAIVESAWATDTGTARDLEASGDLVAAERRWGAIAQTFEALRDTAEAEREQARIDRLPAFREASKALERADAKARQYERDVWPRLGAAFAPGAIPTSYEGLIRSLDIERLEAEQVGGGPAAIAARRLLYEVASQASFYMYREFVAAKRWRDVETLLQLAQRIGPGSWMTSYNLACVRATLGDLDGAVAALQTAAELGFRNLSQLDSDTDLAPLRASSKHSEALAGIRRSIDLAGD